MSDLAAVRAGLAGRYILERELGRGGMATVYLARDLKHSRLVALKVLGAAFNSGAGTERFLNEIRTTARLTHPAILPLHDSGDVAGVPFYTMPWVEGETLRQAMERESRLSLERATEIAWRVADALAFAHDNGVTHRDIKPENILLSRSGHVWIADFGLASALAGSSNERLSSGHILGSPHYMSPEQASGSTHVTSAADVYALGCVLFEMLVGAPPFKGPAGTVLMRHITEQPPEIAEKRADIPAHIADCIGAALVKEPTERPGAARLAAALQNTGDPVGFPKRRVEASTLMHRHVAWTVVALCATALVIVATPLGTTLTSSLAASPVTDSTTYAVMSFDGDSILAGDIAHRMTNALDLWDGIAVSDPLRVADMEGSRARNFNRQVRAAKKVRAFRFVTGSLKKTGGGIEVEARMYDTGAPSRQVSHATARIPLNLSNADVAIASMVDSLLFHGATATPFGSGTRGTLSAPARRAYLDGHAALNDWNIQRADSLFNIALSHDRGYAEAQLWLATARLWRGRPRSEWAALASQALKNSRILNAGEVGLADALVKLSTKDFVAACAAYETLADQYPNTFAALYGLADCLQRDILVVPDRNSPSKWSFRTSAWHAMETYRRAVEILPASHRSWRGVASEQALIRFYAGLTTLRDGTDENGGYYVAAPRWSHDTLAFIPRLQLQAGSSGAVDDSASTALAVRHTRAILHDVTRAWLNAFPHSAPALEAEAVALEMLGVDSAAMVYRSARRAAGDAPDYEMHLEVSELLVRLKQAVPNDTTALKSISNAMDSLLSISTNLTQGRAARLASIAALTGRATLAARLSRIAATNSEVNPLAITSRGLPLMAFAAMNGPVDSIRASERAVDQAIRNTYETSRWNSKTEEWTARAATIAFPVYRSPILTSALAQVDYMVDAEMAFARGDYAHSIRVLDNMQLQRSRIPGGSWKPDAIYPESWLAVRLQGPAAGAARLCPMLTEIAWSEPGAYNDLATAGTLPQAMLLYADVLATLNRKTASQLWYRVVSILWAHADRELQYSLTHRPSVPQTPVSSSTAVRAAHQTCLPDPDPNPPAVSKARS